MVGLIDNDQAVFQMDLNGGQTKISMAALVGASKATMIVIGYGGTGNTTIISRVIVAMMHIGFKVMVTSRSPSALEHLMVAIAHIISKCKLDESLRGKMLLREVDDLFKRLDFHPASRFQGQVPYRHRKPY